MTHSNRAIHTLFIYTLLLASLCLADHTIRGLGHHHHRLARLDASNNTSSTSKSHASPSVHTSTSRNSNTSSDAMQTTTYVSQTSSAQGVSTKSSVATTVSTASSSLSTSTSANAPSYTPQILTKADIVDIGAISQRRITNIIDALSAQSSAASIPGWLSTLGANGMWPASEVDYTTGCAAQRANWPAQKHWHRIAIMAAAWHGGLPNATSFVGNDALRSAISSAVGYWFSNDFTDAACLDSGGLPGCPCGTPGLWNTNWYSNIILIPQYVGQTCLMLNSTLLPSEVDGCNRMILRAYGTFDHYINGIGYLTGANTLDMATVGLDQGLRAMNLSLVTDAYARVHAEVVIQQAVSADGIRPDGSFGQHDGILYNGNYGTVYLNDDLDLETEAGGTQFAAGINSKEALATLLKGDLWMIYRNVITDVLHWDFSVLGRFISFPVADQQATGSIGFNVSEVQQLGDQWQSDALLDVVESLNTNTSDANSGSMVGNRMFYANDYMVQRGSGYVTTVKMYSTRTNNTECTNFQNPFGFHLSDGTVYTYLQGNEYEDISAAWDWNLIPGTTTDYAATPLNCNHTSWTGVQEFVGGVSDGKVGIAAMRYTNPYTGSLSWQKAWFFLENDVQLVMIAGLQSATNAPLYSVLDQKRHAGEVYVDGSKVHGSSNFTSANLLWHGGVGYALHASPLGTPGLSVETGAKSGNWTTIGISTQPDIAVDLFAAYLTHSSHEPVAYSVFPATASHEAFQDKQIQTQIRTVRNDAEVSAIIDDGHSTAMVVFWDALGGSVTIPGQSILDAPVTITADGNSAIMYHYNTGNVTVSDPSQTLTELQVALQVGLLGKKPPHWGWDFAKSFTFDLPSSGSAGSSVSQLLSHP